MIRWVERHRSKIWIVMFFVLVTHADVALPKIKETLSQRVPDVLVFLYPEKGNEYAIVVEKDNQRLFLYGLKSAYRKIYDMKCSTGEVHGTKTRAGDKKTPEGVYFFTKEHKKRDLSPIYGSKAFPIDYPNLLDRIAGHGGNAIWMHGTNKPIEARDSNGCIVLENDDIDKLAKYITLNRTPVIIVDKLTYAPADSVIKEKKYRLITRSDFDGLVCAVLLNELDMIGEILFVHPKEVMELQYLQSLSLAKLHLPFLSFD